ncbi:hypothetical protein BH10BAC5_BH10BAC5_12150 [soil metagenome]
MSVVSDHIKVFTDATARGNPGHSGMGIVIMNADDTIIAEHKEYIGIITNNQAEYSALIKSIELIKKLELDFNKIEFYSDSELMVKQLTGKYKIKDEKLKILAAKFLTGIRSINKNYTLTHILRSSNKLADILANKATDEFLRRPVPAN